MVKKKNGYPASKLSLLERAIEIAVKAHAGQKEKNGVPYVFHPLRLMLQQKTDETRIAAVLHDVVEDTDWTIDDLRKEGFPDRVLKAVESLTRSPDESYDEYLQRARSNPISIQVKMTDLKDNLNLRRIPEPGPKDFKRRGKYKKALNMLKGYSRKRSTPAQYRVPKVRSNLFVTQ